jgi:hypothetical protein
VGKMDEESLEDYGISLSYDALDKMGEFRAK